jgi:hypothetical protein
VCCTLLLSVVCVTSQSQRLTPNQAIPFLARAFVTRSLAMTDDMTTKNVAVILFE